MFFDEVLFSKLLLFLIYFLYFLYSNIFLIFIRIIFLVLEIWFIFFPLFLRCTTLQVLLPDDISISSFPFTGSFWKIKLNFWKKIYVLVIEKVIVSYIYILNLNESPSSNFLFYVFNSLYEFWFYFNFLKKYSLLFDFLVYPILHIFAWCIKRRGTEIRMRDFFDSLKYLKIKNLVNKLNTKLSKGFNGSFLRY